MINHCQVCGDNIYSLKDCSVEADGTPNWDFCSSCYKNGNFLSKDSPVLHDTIYPFKRIFSERAIEHDFMQHVANEICRGLKKITQN